MAELGGADAIVFTGGVGENSHYVRETALSNMKKLGIQIDQEKNKKNEIEISTGRVKILVIPTNEELAIARDTRQILESREREVKKTPVKEVSYKEISLLPEDDKVNLVLLWARNPKASIAELTKKLSNKIGRKIKTEAVKQELEILGLRKTS